MGTTASKKAICSCVLGLFRQRNDLLKGGRDNNEKILLYSLSTTEKETPQPETKLLFTSHSLN